MKPISIHHYHIAEDCCSIHKLFLQIVAVPKTIPPNFGPFLLHFSPVCNIFPLPKLPLLCIFGLVISLRIKEYMTIWATDEWSKSYNQKSDSWKFCQQPIIVFFPEISMHDAKFLKSFRTNGIWMIVNRLCPFSSSFATVFLHFRHFAQFLGDASLHRNGKPRLTLLANHHPNMKVPIWVIVIPMINHIHHVRRHVWSDWAHNGLPYTPEKLEHLIVLSSAWLSTLPNLSATQTDHSYLLSYTIRTLILCIIA